MSNPNMSTQGKKILHLPAELAPKRQNCTPIHHSHNIIGPRPGCTGNRVWRHCTLLRLFVHFLCYTVAVTISLISKRVLLLTATLHLIGNKLFVLLQ